MYSKYGCEKIHGELTLKGCNFDEKSFFCRKLVYSGSHSPKLCKMSMQYQNYLC
jgi:hypothetical protein